MGESKCGKLGKWMEWKIEILGEGDKMVKRDRERGSGVVGLDQIVTVVQRMKHKCSNV